MWSCRYDNKRTNDCKRSLERRAVNTVWFHSRVPLISLWADQSRGRLPGRTLALCVWGERYLNVFSQGVEDLLGHGQRLGEVDLPRLVDDVLPRVVPVEVTDGFLQRGAQCQEAAQSHAISCSCAQTLLIYWIVSQSTIVWLFPCYTERNVKQCILNGGVSPM